MSTRVTSIGVGVLAAVVSFSAVSAAVPKEPGWTGFVQLGYSYNGVENNEVAGIGAGNYKEFTPESIDSIFDSPDGVTEGLPAFNFKLSYTFDTRTELYAGRELVDAVRFDFTQQLGVRQAFPRAREYDAAEKRAMGEAFDHGADARRREVLTAVRSAWLNRPDSIRLRISSAPGTSSGWAAAAGKAGIKRTAINARPGFMALSFTFPGSSPAWWSCPR